MDLRHERFEAANNELRRFLRRVDGLAKGARSLSEGDLRSVSQRIANLAPEVGDASRGAPLDEQLRSEIAEYVRNLRALQSALERARWIVIARKEIESAKRHVEGAKDRVDEYIPTL